MFLQRDCELHDLEKMYASRQFELMILYGRRRVGKTTLLTHFAKKKNAIFFSAGQTNDKENLATFSALIATHYHEDNIAAFFLWEQAFLFVADRQRDERLMVIIDEFPYLAERNKSILSTLQHIIDHRLQNSGIFLILCGSYVGFMEKNVLSKKSPLFGRRTGQLKLRPFDYLDSASFLKRLPPEEQVSYYGALGGTPLYLSRVDTKDDFATNIRRLFLTPSGYFYDEPLFLLREEIKQPDVYNAILSAIASGASRSNEIATKTGEDAAKCLKYIKTLIEMDILERKTPALEKPSSRKSVYEIRDPLFRFWYKYVAPNRSILEEGAADIIWKKRIAPDYPSFMGKAFESVCAQYLIRKNIAGGLPLLFSSIGAWWGSDPETQLAEEVDLVAYDGNRFLFAECKWTNTPVGMDVLDRLQYRADLVRTKRDESWYYLFSKSGFTKGLVAHAKKNGQIRLIGIKDLFR